MYLWSMSNLQGNIQHLPPRGNEATDEGRDPEEGGGREETARRREHQAGTRKNQAGAGRIAEAEREVEDQRLGEEDQ